ncbi:Hint domain-containing protein [Kitasatospora sp. NPDC057965]|uniref:Hint domain-containing protein n=1 Tax=Kitasatospora sp. NPDC057965 TaxID=3346291 RepID=UPI0036DB6133
MALVGDREFTDLTVEAPREDGRQVGANPTPLTTTAHHPFWNTVTQRWEEARDLRVGALLQTPFGGSVALTGIGIRVDEEQTYDLTVSNLHTYYVLAGAVPVLVHNKPPDSCSLTTSPNMPVVNSKTIFKAKDNSFRVDIENQSPGKPGAAIHLQFMGRGADPRKYYYEPATGNWITENGEALSSRLAKQVSESSLNKAFKYLGLNR